MPDSALQREFWAALPQGEAARIRDLVAAGADVNQPIGNPGGETPLIRAVTSGDLDLVCVLLESGADINLPCKGPRSWTPLMFAHDDPAMLRALAVAGADVTARTTASWLRFPAGGMKMLPGGETALHLAAAAGNAQAVKVLIEAGAEVEAKTEDGRAALDYALRLGNATQAAEALVEAGAPLTPQRLEMMHSGAHSPDSDLIAFPFNLEAASDPRNCQVERTRKDAGTPRDPTARAGPESNTPPEFRCPTCHSLIYSRKPKICGHCGTLLPPELVLTDQQAETRDEDRRWARELADTFSTREGRQEQPTLPSASGSHPGGILAETFSAQELLRGVSCAEEFRHRKRPTFWHYLFAYGLILLILALLSSKLRLLTITPTTEAAIIGIVGFLCFWAWYRASPVCPRCQRNIRYCAAAYCHICGKPLSHQRCGECMVDNSWTSFFNPFANAGNFGWIIYFPGCGVQLDSKLTRWRLGRRI